MNEKYKLVFVDGGGNQKIITENHPKLDASNDDKESAMNAVANLYGYEAVRLDLQSDTTVWEAE